MRFATADAACGFVVDASRADRRLLPRRPRYSVQRVILEASGLLLCLHLAFAREIAASRTLINGAAASRWIGRSTARFGLITLVNSDRLEANDRP